MRNLKIDAGLSAKAPQNVTDLKAMPASDGSTKVTVSFTAPTKALNGTDLTTLDKIEVYRGETLVNTFEAPENVKVALGAAEGMVKITWDTPTAAEV